MFLLCVALKTNLTKTWQETESPAGITVQLHGSDYSLDGVTHTLKEASYEGAFLCIFLEVLASSPTILMSSFAFHAYEHAPIVCAVQPTRLSFNV